VQGKYDYTAGFEARAAVSLADPKLRRNVADADDRQIANRLNGMASLKDPERLRDLGSEIRSAVLSRLDQHLGTLADRWESHGGTVYFASSAPEATDYVREVAMRSGATKAVKSKSMVTEEIKLNDVLGEAGVEAVETDLGEYIAQLAGDHPAHIITPIIHWSKDDVAELFSEVSGTPMPAEVEPLLAYARRRLRQHFLTAELGISGVNFAVAEAGALCLATNEGNGRMCTSIPPYHVAIMGMERVVATWDQLAVMLSLLARSGTGQKLTQYTSLLFGPRRAEEADGPVESHLVILDNGRSNLLGTRYQDALKCIRCGACLNVCPVFRQTAGHAYDPVYSGPIGAVINPLLRESEQASELAHASTLCGACTEVCPVRIPLHDLLLYERQEYAAKYSSRSERTAYSVWSHAWSSPRRFKLFASGEALAARLLGPSRLARLPLLRRWARGRALPSLPTVAYRSKRPRR
jgi:L-lactate dehydrogenase complex protein LldF